MPHDRFVSPNTDTLTTEYGNRVTVRRALNVGERDDAYDLCRETITHPDGRPPDVFFNPVKLAKAKLAAYLVTWEFPGAPTVTDLDLGQRYDVIRNLYPDTYDELKDALDAHVSRQDAIRFEQKKTDRTLPDDRTLHLPSGVDGVLSGSAH